MRKIDLNRGRVLKQKSRYSEAEAEDDEEDETLEEEVGEEFAIEADEIEAMVVVAEPILVTGIGDADIMLEPGDTIAVVESQKRNRRIKMEQRTRFARRNRR
jgi:hypothetical protein